MNQSNQPLSSLPSAPGHAIRYLVLDNRVVSSTSNLSLKVGSVSKHSSNPLFIEDKPWEKRFDNLYGNILFDADENLYKCWYSPFIVANSAQGMSLQQRTDIPYTGHKQQEMGICYAISKDGLEWEKPELNLVEFEGNKRNNLVWRGPHGAGIFKDEKEPDAEKRYKAIFQGMNVSFSRDGIQWSEPQKIKSQSVGDTHNHAIWVESLGKYVAFTRTWRQLDGEVEGVESKTNHRWVRQLARIESTDFVNWSDTEVVIEGSCWELQTYAIAVFEYAGVFLGLVEIHDQISDRVWTELVWSPDTYQWNRIDEGSPLLGCGDTQLDYDYGCVYACVSPLYMQDEIRLYYGGSDWLHFGWRNGCLALATLRPDGFAGYQPTNRNESGTLQTSLLPLSGQAISVSADLELGGSLSVRLLNDKSEEIATRTLHESVSDSVVFDRPQAQTNHVRLEFEINRGKLYSFAL